jgi:hypothetical protein
MSLKAFHIVFISISTLFSFGMGVWWINQFLSGEGGRSDVVLGSLAMVGGIALLVYGKYFLKKLKNIDYL